MCHVCAVFQISTAFVLYPQSKQVKYIQQCAELLHNIPQCTVNYDLSLGEEGSIDRKGVRGKQGK